MRRAITDLLTNSQTLRYGVGAFNVYNLEGAITVTEAAEEMKSPAIL
jgi:fructose/tagatose bisphosphate aldolase